MTSTNPRVYRALMAVAREFANGDPQYLDMLCRRYLPGVGAETTELVELRQQFQREATDFDTLSIFTKSDALEDALRELVNGELSHLLVVDVSPSALSLAVIDCNELGVPSLRDPAVRATWSELIPSLPSGAVDQAVALASADAGRGVSGEHIAGVMRAYLEQFGLGEFPRDTRTIVMQRLFAWTAYDLVRGALQAHMGNASVQECPREERRDFVLEEVIREAIADAPIKYDYDLLAAAIDPNTQSVSVERHPLFYREQSRKFAGALHDVPIVAAPTARDTLQIAVVARLGDRVQKSGLIAGVTAALPAGQRCRLLVQLDGPGAVSFPDPPVELAPLRTSLQEILASIPQSIGQLHPVSLDLVCVLDLIGNPAAVAERISRMREVIEFLQEQHPASNNLKIGLLAYRDVIHVEAELDSAPRLSAVEKVELSEPRMVLRKIETLTAFDHPARDLPGALDVALDDLAARFRWRMNSQHSLFTIAAHPPHPAVQGRHRLIPNAHGRDWVRSLEIAREQLALRSVLATDELSEQRVWRPPELRGPAWPRPFNQAVEDYLEDCWTRLGYTDRLELNAVDVESIALRIDPALAEQHQTLRLPIVRS